jgi:hypothetical protein
MRVKEGGQAGEKEEGSERPVSVVAALELADLLIL